MNQRYQLQDTIGSGGMGTVYRAIDTQTEATVAIKTLKADMLTPDMIERFQREGQMLRELNHPNIVQRLDAFEHDGQYYLVMEYVAGHNLQHHIRAGSLTPARSVEIALDIADALTRTHRLGIIHRDIKPANVLIGDDGSVKLTDFGIAAQRQTPRLTDSANLLGTLTYLSPEAFANEPPAPSMDIWALGVVLFEMLTRHPPFLAQSMAQLMHQIVNAPTPHLEDLVSDLPAALIDLIDGLLTKDPRARIPSIRLVGAELERIMQRAGSDGWGGVRLDTATHIMPPRFETPHHTPPRHNLPLDPTPFIGRATELGEVGQLLATPAVRLVTLLGAGGMGKSRLALEFAHQQLAAWPDGVYWVDLAAIGQVSDIISKVAAAVAFQMDKNRDSHQQLLDFFREKTLLLVMDNYEHLLEGAQLCADILAYAPKVKIIATSRERLHLSIETVYALRGMDSPGDIALAHDFDAVQLFLARARLTEPSFELDASARQAVVEICRHVEGMPLALVMAAGWVNMLTPQAILAELRHNLDLLASEAVPDRQRSMQAVFEYSWNRLDENGRHALMSLSVFRGGFTLEAAQAVTGANLRTLQALVNRALVQRDPARRFSLHELLRQYAEAALQTDPAHATAVGERHFEYYMAYLSQQPVYGVPSVNPDDAPLDVPPQQVAALNAVSLELENIIAAWYWGVAHQHWEALGDGTFPLVSGANLRGRLDSIGGLLRHTIAVVEELKDDNAAATCEASCIRHMFLLSLDQAAWDAYSTRLLYLAETNALSPILQGTALLWRARNNQDEALYAEARSVAQRLNHPLLLWDVYSSYVGFNLHQRLDIARTEYFVQEFDRLTRRDGNGMSMTWICMLRGWVAAIQHDLPSAVQWYLHAERLARVLQWEGMVAAALNYLMDCFGKLGQFEEALSAGHAALAIHQRNGDTYGMSFVKESLGTVAYLQGDLVTARAYYEQCLIEFEEIPTANRPMVRAFMSKQVGFLTLREGDPDAARGHFMGAIQWLVDDEWGAPILWDAVVGMAHLIAGWGDPRRALTVAYACRAHPTANRHIIDQAALIERLEGALDAEAIAEAQVASEAIELAALLAQLLAEFGEPPQTE